ncbi:MAG: hypothetical protein H6917_02030 [Novosphingobium sp.]|nr:hypothetical protein [Novosphingobium sp.]MCP5401149.1 hypothetical protein [Novosphingobium sp.]
MTETMTKPASLSPDSPWTWIDDGFEPLFAMSWRDCEEAQLAALKLQFEKLNGPVAALEKLSRREGVHAIDSVEDALPLLFDHRIYKSYPLSLIENRDFPKLNAWLNRLTTKDLSQVDLSGLDMMDDWLDRLDEFGMLIGHSSGTTGKLSFVPRSRDEFPSWQRSYYEAQRATTGVNAYTDPVETFFPGYRGGHQMMMKMLSLFNIPAAGGPEHYHTLYQGHISSDLMSLAGRMQAAEDRGELAQLGLDPALLKAREEMIAQAKRRDQDIEAWFFKLFEEFRGKRVKLGGTFADLIRTARSGIDKGLQPEFGPGSFIMTGGGMKGFKDAPDDWEGFVKDYFGIDTIGMFYGMSEVMSMSPRCSAGNFHIMPVTIPLLFDKDMNLLPREGAQTGRYAFFDLMAQTYWGGFISGDQVTIHWDEDCSCGWKQPYVGPVITRFSEMEGGDDKITCAGTAQAYNEFMDYISEV